MDRKKFFSLTESWYDKRKILQFILFFVLIILFGITRLWKLTTLPYGMHIDEASMTYTAWSLAEYGVDRYLNPWPVYFSNFDSGQSAMYVYLCVALFKIFGYHLILVRLPAVLFSFLNLIFGILIARKIFPQNKIIPLFIGGLTVICPYFIMAGRFALDCNLMLGMSTIFLYYFIEAIEGGQTKKYILAGLTGGLVLYTYALSYIVLPIFLILALAYIIRVKKFLLRGWFSMAFPMGILAFPLILVQIITIFDLEQFSLGCFTITKLGSNRAAELNLFSCEGLWDALNVILVGDVLNYNTAPEYKNLYGLTIVFFLLGAGFILRSFWESIRDRKLNFQAFPLLWLISMLLLGSMTAVSVNRMNGVFYSVIFLAAVGINGLCMMLKKHSVTVVALVSAIYLLIFGKFANYYFGGTYTEENFMLSLFDIPITEATDFIEQDSVLCQKKTQMVEPGVYYLLEKPKSPYELDMRKIETEHCYGNYLFETLGTIEDQYNYIVADNFGEYAQKLRDAGFTEERYQRYSLFYKK